MSVIELLKNLQLTESEAKVYVALSQYGPQTGYEVSKTSGVPRSKVYNILESLEKEELSVLVRQSVQSFIKQNPLIWYVL